MAGVTEGAEIHRVNYQLRDDDLRELFRLSYARQRVHFSVGRWILAWVVFYPLVPMVPFILAGRWTDFDARFGYGLMVCTGAAITYQTYRTLTRARQNWIKSPAIRRLLQPSQIALLPDRVTTSSPLSEASYAWSLFTDIVRQENAMYFWLGDAMAIVVPKRAFGDQHAFDCFTELAFNFRDQFRGGALGCPQCGYDLRGNPQEGCPECGWRREANAN